jgi:hypothetical protein
MYLQNSGNLDIIWSHPNNRECDLVEEEPNIYRWHTGQRDLEYKFIIHMDKRTSALSDMHVETDEEYKYIVFTDKV